MPTTVSESPARIPGWTRLKQDSGSSFYRAPDGSEVGQFVYKQAFEHYRKTGVSLQTPPGEKWRQMRRTSSGKTPAKQETFEDLVTNIPIGDEGESIALEMPESKPSTHKPRSGLFSAKDIGQGLSVVLVIITALLAIVTKLPEAQMTEGEVRAISIPLANIIERSRYNRTIGAMIVDKSDYLTLGYALYVYIDRVASAARERRANGPPQYASPTAGPTDGASNGAIPSGLPLRTTPAGLRNVGN